MMLVELHLFQVFILHYNLKCTFALYGPARSIFKDRLGSIPLVSLEEAINSCSWVITGTGWQTDIEYLAIDHARTSRKFVVSFLDHWTSYPQRFIRNATVLHPNEIWVGDSYAARLASKTFPRGFNTLGCKSFLQALY